MKNYSRKSFIILLLALSLHACKTEEIDSGIIVYACGVEKASNGNFIGKFWENTNSYNLNDSTTEAITSSIFVKNNDVFIAGYECGKGKQMTAKYWKNGISVDLTDGKYMSWAKCIYVTDSTVYVSGYEETPTGQFGTLWMNGKKVRYTSELQSGNINCVFVNENKTYLCGLESTNMNGNHFKYWINDFAYSLGNGVYGSDIITSIYNYKGDTYVTGRMSTVNDVNYDYWINGKPYTLKNGNVSFFPNSLFVLNDNVYIAGYTIAKNNNYIAKYWVNGNEVNLTDESQNANAYTIYVLEDDIFVGGSINGKPCYWHNGKLVKLNNDVGGAVHSIFVTRK